MKVRTGNRLNLREAWLICFFLGLVMLNFPFLHIFNKDVQVLGIPLIILYLMVGWPLSIVVIWLFSLLLGSDEEDAADSSPPPDQT